MTIAVPDPARHAAYKTGATALLLAAAAILGALAFEHLGGIVPCELCLTERYAYYAGVPLLFAALVLLSAGLPRSAAVVFFLTGLAFIANAVLGGYHAGVEWHFWPGPGACTGVQQLSTSAGDLMNALAKTRVVRCDEAAWRMFGISLAGWNALASALIAVLALRAAQDSTRVQ
jgi:disulfide bond formation protein DsbB